jgi:Arginyl-tRNA synthetase
MNIFKFYKNQIIDILKSSNDEVELILPENLESINVDIPPAKFNCDLSSNVAMILSKPNNKSPIEIGNKIAILIKSKEKFVDEVTVEKPWIYKH